MLESITIYGNVFSHWLIMECADSLLLLQLLLGEVRRSMHAKLTLPEAVLIYYRTAILQYLT
jgi:hypothetical protein